MIYRGSFKDRLWIASWQKHGLLCYDHGELTSYTVDDGLFFDRIRVVCERSDGGSTENIESIRKDVGSNGKQE